MAIFIEQPLPCLGKKVLQPEIKIEECVKQTKKLKKTKGNSQCSLNRRKIPECRGSLNERSCFPFSIAPDSENKTLQGASWADLHEYPFLRPIVKSLGCFQKCQLSTSESSCKLEKQEQVKVKLSKSSKLNPFFTNIQPCFMAFMVWVLVETTRMKQQP